MGQAVDLPDPLEPPAAPAMASADDLLSQMAGEEIDRLLAEAEVQYTTEDLSAPANEPSPIDESETPAPAEITSEKAAAQNAQQNADLAAELDQVFNQASANGGSQDKNSQTDHPIADASATVKEIDEALAKQSAAALPQVQAAVNDLETSLDERNALTATSAQTSTDGTPASLSSDDDEAVPIWLKPLVWLNAPMAILPEAVRDALGKVAILTLFNAVAVLAYVMVFRKHR